MFNRLLTALLLLPIIGLMVYTVLLNPSADASPQQPTVVTKTRGYETLEAEIVNDQVRVTLKNNHKRTITAFAISFGDTYRITEDFAYSDVHLGIAPGEVFARSYNLPPLPTGAAPTLYLLTVLLENGGHDGDALAAQKIKDERLGQKIQVLRSLKILERHQPKDIRLIKDEVSAALNTTESETLITLNELQPAGGLSNASSKLSDDVRQGLQIGREKMLKRVEILQQVPSESLDEAFSELKQRSNNLLAKL